LIGRRYKRREGIRELVRNKAKGETVGKMGRAGHWQCPAGKALKAWGGYSVGHPALDKFGGRRRGENRQKGPFGVKVGV